jgi:hypothetical protein
MRHRTRVGIVSTAAGFGLAGVLQVVALLAMQAGEGRVAGLVDWPATLLRTVTSSDSAAIFAGLPLGGFVYSVLAYLLFRKALAEGKTD